MKNNNSLCLIKRNFGKIMRLKATKKLSLIFALGLSVQVHAELDILVVGSSTSFSDYKSSSEGRRGVPEKAFEPSLISNCLRDILSNDPAINEGVNVEFEDIYKTSVRRVGVGQNNTSIDYEFHCHSLLQHFMWPSNQQARLKNIRGEGDHQWDYIILMADPYLMANMPGVYAQGVKMIYQEIAKSSNPAKLVLMSQWPDRGSTFTVDHYNEVTHRVGNSGGITVVPAGKAWDAYDSKDINAAHPTPRGAYIAAAAIYSKLFGRNAKQSDYRFDNDTVDMADLAQNTVLANEGVDQYTGDYTKENVYQMGYERKRTIDFNHFGSSTERGFEDGLREALSVARVGVRERRATTADRNEISYSRANLEFNKQYRVNPALYDRVYGFPVGDHRSNSGATSMRYGIDKRYFVLFDDNGEVSGRGFTDSTDFAVAYNMIRDGEVSQGTREIPVRALWAQLHYSGRGYKAHRDAWHMSRNIDDSAGAFMYTLSSGRCPVPVDDDSNVAFARRVGYETAWTMSHLSVRAPGFQVLPSSVAESSVESDSMEVRFLNPPQSDVTVEVRVSDPNVATVSPSTLVFTPENYMTAQQVSVVGKQGASGDIEVTYTTSSDDEVYDELSDSWSMSVIGIPTFPADVEVINYRFNNNEFSASNRNRNAAYTEPDTNTFGEAVSVSPLTMTESSNTDYSRFTSIGGETQEAVVADHNGSETISFTVDIDEESVVDFSNITFDTSYFSTNSKNTVFSWTFSTIIEGVKSNVTSGGFTHNGGTNYQSPDSAKGNIHLSGLTGLTNKKVTFVWEVSGSRSNTINRQAMGLDDILLTGNVSNRIEENIRLQGFESESLEEATVVDGFFGNVITDREVTFTDSAILTNNEGDFFLSTGDTATVEHSLSQTGTIRSGFFQLESPYVSLLIGGHNDSKEVYFAIYEENGTEIIRVANSIDSEVMERVELLLFDYIGENVYWQVVDNATDAFITIDSLQFGFPDSSIVSHWPFNEEGNDEAYEIVRGYNGLISNAEQSGGAVHFNGVDSAIVIPSKSFNNIEDEITIALWIKGAETQPRKDSVIYAVDANGNRILNIHLPWSNGHAIWDAGHDGKGYNRVSTAVNLEDVIGSNSHWVFTKNATTGEMAIYVNGKLIKSDLGKTFSISEITSAVIGRDGRGRSYEGFIDDLKLFNSALDAEEVADLFESEAVTPLVVYAFNKINGGVVTDRTGKGFDGQVVNGVSNGATLDFNGTNSSLSIPDEIFTTIDDEISISIWANGDVTQPRADTIFNAVNASGKRILNIHLPWKDSRVIWDAGNDGRSYERVYEKADASTYRKSLNHWMFTKNVLTGEMAIYVNGELLVSELGNTFPIQGITKATIGSSVSGKLSYDGEIDEFSIYKSVLTPEQVREVFEAGTLQD